MRRALPALPVFLAYLFLMAELEFSWAGVGKLLDGLLVFVLATGVMFSPVIAVELWRWMRRG